MRKNRPDHRGRTAVRKRQESFERAHLNAYIRQLRSGLEGPKGGFDPKDKWTIGKMPVPKRWQKYKERRIRLGLPVIGSESLFTKLWREHKEIVEVSAKGHATCDRCVSSACMPSCFTASFSSCAFRVFSPSANWRVSHNDLGVEISRIKRRSGRSATEDLIWRHEPTSKGLN